MKKDKKSIKPSLKDLAKDRAINKVVQVFQSRLPIGRANSPSEKRKVMESLLAAWNACPQLRLGQLLTNVGLVHGCEDLFYVEDHKLVELAFAYVNKHSKPDA